MRKPKHHRPLALLLCAALFFGQPGATAYAEGPPSGAGGLCAHHAAHDAAVCGYAEALPGQDCGHEHTPECYTDELICGMDEGAEQTAGGSGAGHRHEQTCYGLDCPHERGEHDEACGYAVAVAGMLCGYVCGECGKEPDKESGTAGGNHLPAPVEPEEPDKESGTAGGNHLTAPVEPEEPDKESGTAGGNHLPALVEPEEPDKKSGTASGNHLPAPVEPEDAGRSPSRLLTRWKAA